MLGDCPAEDENHSRAVVTVSRSTLGKIENHQRQDHQQCNRFEAPRVLVLSKQTEPRSEHNEEPQQGCGNADSDQVRYIVVVQRTARPLFPRPPPQWEVLLLINLALDLIAVTEEWRLRHFLQRKCPDVSSARERCDVSAIQVVRTHIAGREHHHAYQGESGTGESSAP